MKTKLNKTFIIQHKVTKELWIADSGKSSWKQTNHAKSAWKRSRHSVPTHLQEKGDWGNSLVPMPFNNQDEYECVELKSPDTLLVEKINNIV